MMMQPSAFGPTSRYAPIPSSTLVMADGRTIVYVGRRFVPSPDRFALLQWHVVTAPERLDTITARYLGDPEQFWRLCDANNAMNPFDLARTPGTRLRITLPEGVPGPPAA